MQPTRRLARDARTRRATRLVGSEIVLPSRKGNFKNLSAQNTENPHRLATSVLSCEDKIRCSFPRSPEAAASMGVLQVALPAATPPAPRAIVIGLAGIACLAAVALDAPFLISPVLFADDLDVVAQSWTWPQTVAGLWVPQNEHAMPLGRLLTYSLVRLAGGPTGVPRLICWVGPLALVAAMLMVGGFVRRELGDVRYGLLAMTLFGVTSVYMQVVWWFSASYGMLVVDMLLLGLLAAQAWQRSGRLWSLLLVLLAVALAPGWFASGILAGPLIALYLVPWGQIRAVCSRVAERMWDGSPEPSGRLRRAVPHPARAWLGVAAALAGSVLFLVVSLPRSGAAILHAEHYGGKSALEAFHLSAGLAATARSVVDNLLLGVAGVGGLPWSVSLPLALPIVGGLIALGVWWWRPALRSGTGLRLLPLGLALIGVNYVLVYSARAEWGYDEVGMNRLNWNRYHLMPQLGLVLLVVGALPARLHGSVLVKEGLTRRQARWLAVLVGACFLVQLPRALLCYFPYFMDTHQAEILAGIEQVDACCREHHIGADAAREALEPRSMPTLCSEVNRWVFLYGSPEPWPRPKEEIRHLLEEVGALADPPAPPPAGDKARPARPARTKLDGSGDSLTGGIGPQGSRSGQRDFSERRVAAIRPPLAEVMVTSRIPPEGWPTAAPAPAPASRAAPSQPAARCAERPPRRGWPRPGASALSEGPRPGARPTNAGRRR
jgi:hypothetical protein